MMCMVQLALAVLGGVLISKRQLRVGSQVATAPTPFLMGLTLVLQLPLVLMIGFGLGFSEGLEMAKKNQGKQVSQAEMTAQMSKFQQKYWWIDIVIPTGAAAVAGVLLALGLKDRQPESQDPHADPYAGADAPLTPVDYDEPRPRRKRTHDPFDVIDDEPRPRRNRATDEF